MSNAPVLFRLVAGKRPSHRLANIAVKGNVTATANPYHGKYLETSKVKAYKRGSSNGGVSHDRPRRKVTL